MKKGLIPSESNIGMNLRVCKNWLFLLNPPKNIFYAYNLPTLWLHYAHKSLLMFTRVFLSFHMLTVPTYVYICLQSFLCFHVLTYVYTFTCVYIFTYTFTYDSLHIVIYDLKLFSICSLFIFYLFSVIFFHFLLKGRGG